MNKDTLKKEEKVKEVLLAWAGLGLAFGIVIVISATTAYFFNLLCKNSI